MPPVAEPPSPNAVDQVEPLSTSLGALYKQTLAKNEAANAEPAPKTDAVVPDDAAIEAAKAELAREAEAKATIASDAEKAAKEKAAAAKPKSALDTVLGDKVEPTPVEQDILAEFDAKNPDWKKAREVMKTQSEELKRYRSESAKSATVDPAIKGQLEAVQKERDAIREERDKLKDAVVALNVDYDPEVQAKFVDGKQRLLDRATDRTKEFGGDAEAFKEAMKLPAGKAQTAAMRDALVDVDEIDRPRIISLVEQIRGLDEEYADLKKDPQQAWKTLSERRQMEQQSQYEESERTKQAVFDKVLKALPASAKLITRVDDSAEGAPEWNADLDAALNHSKHLLSTDAKPEDIMAAAIKGSRYDFVEKLLLDERSRSQQEITELRTQLAKYESSDPGFKGGQKTPKNDPMDKTPGAIFRETMEKTKQSPV